jgi:hypothetical protein
MGQSQRQQKTKNNEKSRGIQLSIVSHPPPSRFVFFHPSWTPWGSSVCLYSQCLPAELLVLFCCFLFRQADLEVLRYTSGAPKVSGVQRNVTYTVYVYSEAIWPEKKKEKDVAS